MKIVLDAGHGLLTAGKRSPDGEREWAFNDKVARAAEAALLMYRNVQVKRADDRSGRRDVPLTERVRLANEWKADLFISIHHNANTGLWGMWTGAETYVYSGLPFRAEACKIAEQIQPRLADAMNLRSRGVKRADFYVLRHTNMPAVLTEGGFMDSTIDIQALRSEERLRAQGEAIAASVAVYYGLTRRNACMKQ